MALEVNNLAVKVANKEVLKGVSFKVAAGEVVALMGPNGSGKSSLAYTIAGHPTYLVSKDKNSKISLDDESLLEKTPDERARLGLFLAAQYPVAIPGVTVREALLSALRAREDPPSREASGGQGKVSALELKKSIELIASDLAIDEELLSRGLNVGFSGGEKKKMEILQMTILAPKYAILDETDSGLDIDALKIVARGAVNLAKKKKIGILVITHYQRLLTYLKPDRVLVMKEGRIVREGGAELVSELEKSGYQQYE